MSVDALTFIVNKGAENVNGRLLEQYASVLFSSGYPTGGYTFPVSLATEYGQLGIRTLVGVSQVATNTAGLAYTASWNSQTGKLLVFTAGSQVADNTNIATVGVTLKLTGTR